MKPVHFLSPRLWSRLNPLVLPLRHTKGPVEQISHVGKDLDRSARAFSQLKTTKSGWSIALDFSRAVSDRRECVPQKRALGIAQCQSGSSVRVST